MLVIWIERDEQVECRCASEEKDMTEVYYKVKPWNGDLNSQHYQILPFLFFFSDIQYRSVFGAFSVFLCSNKHGGVYYIFEVSREKLFFSNCFTSVIDPFFTIHLIFYNCIKYCILLEFNDNLYLSKYYGDNKVFACQYYQFFSLIIFPFPLLDF